MKKRHLTFFIFAMTLHCGKGSGKDTSDLQSILFLNLLSENNFSVKLVNADANSQSRALDRNTTLPSKFRDALPTQIIPVKNLMVQLVRLYLWKSPSFGGAPSGGETKENADLIIFDHAKDYYGDEAGGKSAYPVFQGPLLQNDLGFGSIRSNGERVVTYIDERWKDKSYDRIGIEFQEIRYVLEDQNLSSKEDQIVTLKTQIFDDNRYVTSQSESSGVNWKSIKNVPINTIETYSVSGLSNEEFPCRLFKSQSDYTKYQMSTDLQKLWCGTFMNLPIHKLSASATHPGYNGEFPTVTNPPVFSESELTQFSQSGTRPSPFLTESLQANLAKWEVRSDLIEYQSNIWNASRIVVITLPEKRNKPEILIDGSVGLVYQTQVLGNKFETNPIPKLNVSILNNEDRWLNTKLSLDSTWLTAYGNDYSAWSYAPKNGNQPDPTNGRDFGYFLPKFSVTAE